MLIHSELPGGDNLHVRTPGSAARYFEAVTAPRPSGTVTFLFTDIEGSSECWDRRPEAMAAAMRRHDALLRHTIDAANGYVFSTNGDGFFAAFASAAEGMCAAASAQRALADEVWPEGVSIRVRMGLHTGVAEERDGDYFGTTVIRAARIGAAAAGGQVLVSAATTELLADGEWTFFDAGRHKLRGLERPEHLFRLHVADLPDVEFKVQLAGNILGNLPRQRAPLIGRRYELDQIAAAMAPGTLMTMSGVGGVGKTSVALAAARAVGSDEYPDGVWLVELAIVTTADAVAAAVAQSLDLRIDASPVSPMAVAAALGSQRRLVVIDNCEHVVAPAREIVDALLANCPGVTILATSRERLDIAGEHVLHMEPLAVAADDGHGSNAVEMLHDRILAVDGAFNPTADEIQLMSEVCPRLDGLPLAIELAAARVPAFGLADLARLTTGLDVLDRHHQNDRRHSMRATIAWSYDLLSSDEQLALERISVFAGGFELDAATYVCGFGSLSGGMDDHVASLVDQSLVSRVPRSSPARYQQLEVVRQFAHTRLAERGDAPQARTRHLDYFVDWIGRADAGVRGPDELSWHRRLEAEWPNLRVAVRHAVDTESAASACSLLWHLTWWTGTRLRLEARQWADNVAVMPSASTNPLLAIVLAMSCGQARRAGDIDASERALAAAQEVERNLGAAPEPWVSFSQALLDTMFDPQAVVDSMREVRARVGLDPFWEALASWWETNHLAVGAATGHVVGEEADDVIRALRNTVALAERTGNPTVKTLAWMNLGSGMRRRSPHEALGLLERALATAEAVGARGVIDTIYHDLGPHLTSLGRSAEALERLAPSIREFARSGAMTPAVNSCIAVAGALVDLGEPRQACVVFGAVSDRIRRTPVWRDYFVGSELEPRLRSLLGDATVEELSNEGRAASSTDIVATTLEAIDRILADDALRS